MSGVERLITYLDEQLNDEDIDHTEPKYSNTDYGESAYIRIYDERLEGYPKFKFDGPFEGIKVRISDHSADSNFRMKNEVMFFPKNHDEKNIDFFINKLLTYIPDDEEE